MELNVEDMTAGALLGEIVTELVEANAIIGNVESGGRHGRVLVKLPNGQVFALSAEEVF